MVSIGSTNASPSSLNSQKENAVSPTKTVHEYSPGRNECSKSFTMPALSQLNKPSYYSNHHNEAPIRYVDDSASSTVSSRNGGGAQRYFYERDDSYDDEPTVLINRPYRTSFDYDTPPAMTAYSSSPPHRHFSTSPAINNSRVHNSVFYPTPHSLPRVSLSDYRNHEYPQRLSPTANYSNNPNVTCVKTCSVGNGLKNK